MFCHPVRGRWSDPGSLASYLRQRADPDVQREQAAGLRLLLEIGGREVPDRRGDIERLQIRPTEHAARRLLHGQIDDAIETAVRRIARQPPTVPLRIPKIPFRVDRRAVRTDPRALKIDNLAAVRERSILMIV